MNVIPVLKLWHDQSYYHRQFLTRAMGAQIPSSGMGHCPLRGKKAYVCVLEMSGKLEKWLFILIHDSSGSVYHKQQIDDFFLKN